MKLYYAPRTRSTRPRWLLEELGIPYELHRLDMSKDEHKAPSYMEIHPHGAVPAFEDGNLQMIESAAICMYLADKFAEKRLAPAIGSADRGRYYQWVVYSMATLEPAVYAIYQHKVGLPPEKRSPAALEEAVKKFETCCKALKKALSGKDYLAGNSFTVADILVASILGWSRALGALEGHGDLSAYTKRCTDRPAYKKATAD